MKRLFDEYADFIVTAVISFVAISIFVYVVLTNLIGIGLEMVNDALEPVHIEKEINPVTIKTFIGKDILIQLNEELNYTDRVEAFNSNDEDIKDYVSIIGFDNKEVGEKEITYLLNYNGQRQAIRAKLIVVDEKEEIST